MSFDPDFGRPVPGNVRAVGLSGWGRPRAGTHPHQGLDIPLRVGTPIYALADGVTVRVQPTDDGDAGGIRIAVRHASGLVSRYMHLSRVAVGMNQRVRRGQVIGTSGDTGVGSSGPHLHVDLKAPAQLLPAIRAVVGEPAGGFGPLQAGYGYGIPAEPWVPVDEYIARTRNDAAARGIPLYRSRAGWLGLAVGLAVGYGVYRLVT